MRQAFLSAGMCCSRGRDHFTVQAVTRHLHYLVLFFGILLAGCGRPSVPVPAPEPSPTPVPVNAIPVGAILPLSGSQSGFGEATVEGIHLAVARINAEGGIEGRPVHLLIRDTNSKPEEAAALVRRLVEENHVAAVIGDVTSEASLAAAPVAAELGVPMISPGATHPDVTIAGSGIFRVCFVDPFQCRVMSKFASSIGVTRAAILFDSADPYSTVLAGSFEEDFLARGGTISAKESVPANGPLAPVLEKIKAAQPEVIFLPLYYAQAAGIIKQARPLGLDQPFIGTDGWESPEFLKMGGKALDNTYFASHFSAGEPSERTQAFVAAFKEKFGHPPLALAALGYDAVNFLAQGIRRAGGTEAGALIQALSETAGFEGVTGNITLDEDRNPTKPAIVVRVDGGTFQYLETVSP